MDKMQAVKDFVIDVLGCKCPEEVFRDMRLDKSPGAAGGVPLLFDIRVGGRLLIFGVAAEHLKGSATALATLAAAGLKTRDEGGFNRFRLVVVSSGDVLESVPRGQWAELPGLDERMHLHVVAGEDLKEFIR